MIVSSMLLVGLMSAVFGFSVSFEMAFIFRFLAGLFNGEHNYLSVKPVI